MKKLICGIVMVIVMLIAAQSVIPGIMNGLIKGAVVSAVEADNVQINAQKTPAILMLLGKFDAIEVSLQGLHSGKVKFKTFDVVLNNIHVDIAEVVLNRQLSVDSMDTAKLKAVFAQEDLAELLNQSVRGISNAKVELTSQGAKVFGQFNVGGLLKTSVEIDGNIIDEKNVIIFRTGQFNIAQGALGRFGGNLATDIVLVDLNKMPFDVTVKNIILKDGFVEVYADSNQQLSK